MVVQNGRRRDAGRRRRRCARAAVLAVLLVAGVAAGQSREGVVPLIAPNDDYRHWLEQADAMAADPATVVEAIEAYQTLVERGQTSLFLEEDGIYRSVSQEALDRIGALPAEAMALYRTRHDPKARQLYEQARAAVDEPALHRLADLYFHTAYGDRAADLLAQLQFDRGQFARAARAWDRLLARTSPPSVPREQVLVRSAIAWHLAGDDARRDERLDRLRAEFPGAAGVLAGREQPLADAVAALTADAPPAWVAAAPPAGGGWLSLGGSPDGVRVMPESNVILAPRWRVPQAGPAEAPEVKAFLGSLSGMAQAGPEMVRQTVELQEGQVQVAISVQSSTPMRFAVPALTHPAVVEVDGRQLVVVRHQDRVTFYDLVTGAGPDTDPTLGQSLRLPMERTVRQLDSRNYGYSPWMMSMLGDTGRYGVTVGGDLVFALAEFAPDYTPFDLQRWPELAERLSDDSALVAISISKQGYLEWQVGRGYGDDELLKAGKFITLPTYVDGRLYTIVQHTESYHLVCLDARAKGALLWRSLIGQTPVMPDASYMNTRGLLERGSPPAVADGAVFVTTNAGLIAAFSADTGRTLWAYQYGSGSGGEAAMRGGPGGRLELLTPPSPLIVTKGLVIVQPADDPNVYALHVEDGTLAWRVRHDGRGTMTALGPDQVLLTGRGISVVDAATGKRLWEYDRATDAYGRPAVTPSAALVSGAGRLYRVARLGGDQFKLETIPLQDRDAMLGNLISAGDKLVAANAGSLCVFMSFEEAYRLLTERYERLEGPAGLAVLIERGSMALDAGRLDVARRDLEQAFREARETDAADLLARVRPVLYDLYVACANAAEPPEMGELLAMARDQADRPSLQAEMLVRFCRYRERTGDVEQAARDAQALAEQFAAVDVRDVPLGPTAGGAAALEDLRAQSGLDLGRRLIAELIERHGQEAYAEFDMLAAEALDGARASSDVEAMLGAQRRYFHSQWADDLLFAAAETLYRDALAAEPVDVKLLYRAERVLADLERYRESPLWLSGRAGQALIQMRLDPNLARVVSLSDFQGVEGTAEVRFGDFQGKVDTLVQRILTAGNEPLAPNRRPIARLTPPLTEIYRVNDPTLEVLRDGRGEPVRLGSRVMLVQDEMIVCLDTQADSFADGKGIVWRGMTGLDRNRLAQDMNVPNSRRLVGHLNRDGSLLGVADRESFTVIETVTGKVRQRGSLNLMGIPQVSSIAGAADWLLFASEGDGGRIRAVDMGTGKVAWTSDANPLGRPDDALLLWPGDDGLVLVQDASLRLVRCYEIGGDSKPLFDLRGSGRTDAAMLPEGRLLVLRGGELSLHDARAGARETIWRQRIDPRQATLIGVGDGVAAVCPSQQGTRVQVIDLADGRVRAQLAVPARPRQGQDRLYPLLARFDGDRMYVLCGLSPQGLQNGLTGAICQAQAPAVLSVDLSAWRSTWGPVGVNDEMPMVTENMGFDVIDRHVVAAIRPSQWNQEGVWVLLEHEDGREAARGALPAIDPTGRDAGRTIRRQRVLGGPVVTNGRMLLETAEGLVLLGGRSQ